MQAAATRVHREYRRADLVDANSARAAAYGALAARASRTPFVVHLRDTVDAAALGEVGSAIMRRLVLPRADGVVGNSRLTLQTALPFLRPGAATVVIPSASGLRAGPPVPGPREPGPLRVGMLARIDPWKGQALLIEAFAAAFPGDTVLEIAGAAPFGHEDHREELRTQAERLGVADRVAFLGHVDDVDALLARWDVAVQYSTRPEPLGQNVLQYLAAGRAVVVADEGGRWSGWTTGSTACARHPVTCRRSPRRCAGSVAIPSSGPVSPPRPQRRRAFSAMPRWSMRTRCSMRRCCTGATGCGAAASRPPRTDSISV